MKKIVLTLLILTVAASFAFADEGEEPAPPVVPAVQADVTAAPATPASTTAAQAPKRVIREVTLREATPDFVIGKVDCVMPSDLFTRTRSRVTIVDTTGTASEFVVKALVVIYDASGKFLSLNSVQPGQEVQINYITKRDGTREAASIRILK